MKPILLTDGDWSVELNIDDGWASVRHASIVIAQACWSPTVLADLLGLLNKPDLLVTIQRNEHHEHHALAIAIGSSKTPAEILCKICLEHRCVRIERGNKNLALAAMRRGELPECTPEVVQTFVHKLAEVVPLPWVPREDVTWN